MSVPLLSRLEELQRSQRDLEMQLQKSSTQSNPNSTLPTPKLNAAKEKYTVAMKKYFDAVTYIPPKAAKRTEAGKVVIEPFSFEHREATRVKTIAERKFEAEMGRRQREEEEMRAKSFCANPVPPSTYLEKYSWMVREWEYKREAMHEKAVDKCAKLRASEEKAQQGVPVPHCVPQFGQTSVVQPRSGGGTTSQRRSRSAGDWRVKPRPFRAKPVPEYSKDDTQRDETKRKESMKLRADWMLAIAHGPSRMEEAERRKLEVPESAARKNNVYVSTPLPGSLQPSLFPFRPKINADTPDYALEWTMWQDRLVKRKEKRRSVSAQPPAHYMRPRVEEHKMIKYRREAKEPSDNRWPGRQQQPPPPPRSSSDIVSKPIPSAVSPPRMTHAHRVRSQEVLLRLSAKAAQAEEVKREAAARRAHSREVTKRVAPLVEDLGAQATKAIQRRTRDRRRDDVHKTLEYESRIKDLKQKVRERPPIFYEPTHYYDEASRRAAAELNFHGVLSQHGVGGVDMSAFKSAAAAAGVGGGSTEGTAPGTSGIPTTTETYPPPPRERSRSLSSSGSSN